MEINQINETTKHSMRTRVITGLVMLFTLAPCVILGGYFHVAVVVFVLTVATFEILRSLGKKFSPIVYIASYLVVFSLTFWTMTKNMFGDFPAVTPENWFYMGTGGYFLNGDNPFDIGSISGLFVSTAGVALCIAIFFLTVVIDKNFTIRDATFIFTMLVVISLGIQSVLFLRFYPYTLYEISGPWMDKPIDGSLYWWFLSSMLLIYVLIGTIATDVGGYFFGLLFGKKKLNERISPKKTIEGFVGGIIFSVIMSFGFAITFAATGIPILPIFDLDNWWIILIVSLAMPFFAVLGDLSFSAIKREQSIKDFGNVFPGHGGVLDRFDSLLFTSAVTTILVSFFSIGWNLLG